MKKVLKMFDKKRQEGTTVFEKFEKYFSKELAYDLLRTQSSVLLFFSTKDGWLGANKAFFELLSFEDMDDFLQYHKSVREIFVTESENVFPKDDLGWIEYIRKKRNGKFRVAIRVENELRKYRVFVSHSFHFQELFIIELEDITEIELTQSKTKELENLKSQFLANISHEFRTPMNGVLGFIELLEHTKLDKQQQNYLSLLKRSSSTLLSNVESLLDLSLYQNGGLRLHNEYFDILKLCDALALEYSKNAYESGKRFYAFVDPALPLEIFSDSKRLHQVLSALLQHALNFTQSGDTIFFDIKAIRENVNNTYDIGFSIKHNGKGLSKEDIASIKEPFSSYNNRYLGIGLVVANTFAQLLGSELEIRSRIDKGSLFSFILRVKFHKKREYQSFSKNRITLFYSKRYENHESTIYLSTYLKAFGMEVAKTGILNDVIMQKSDFLYYVIDEEDIQKSDIDAIHKPKILLQQFGQKFSAKSLKIFEEIVHEPLLPNKIYRHLLMIHELKNLEKEEGVLLKKNLYALVVEDNAINQKLLEFILKNKGISIALAADGVEAVEMAQKEPYDIIFMDIDMPKKDGVKATYEIKQMDGPNKSTPIIALTSMAMEGDKERLLAKGLDDYISKPIKQDELQFILNKYLLQKSI